MCRFIPFLYDIAFFKFIARRKAQHTTQYCQKAGYRAVLKFCITNHLLCLFETFVILILPFGNTRPLVVMLPLTHHKAKCLILPTGIYKLKHQNYPTLNQLKNLHFLFCKLPTFENWYQLNILH